MNGSASDPLDQQFMHICAQSRCGPRTNPGRVPFETASFTFQGIHPPNHPHPLFFHLLKVPGKSENIFPVVKSIPFQNQQGKIKHVHFSKWNSWGYQVDENQYKPVVEISEPVVFNAGPCLMPPSPPENSQNSARSPA